MPKINNDINEIYCSFEVSKLLKEKGFKRTENTHQQRANTEVWYDANGNKYGGGLFCYAPTHATAIQWLYQNFGIWIWIERGKHAFIDNESHSAYNSLGQFNSSYEATEATLLYTLKNLIN